MLYRLGKPLLFCLDPEKAHHLAMWGARKGGEWLGKRLRGTVPDGKPVEVAGLTFKNPIGLAAGFDKNGVALPFWRGVGFGARRFWVGWLRWGRRRCCGAGRLLGVCAGLSSLAHAEHHRRCGGRAHEGHACQAVPGSPAALAGP